MICRDAASSRVPVHDILFEHEYVVDLIEQATRSRSVGDPSDGEPNHPVSNRPGLEYVGSRVPRLWPVMPVQVHHHRGPRAGQDHLVRDSPDTAPHF